MEACPHCDRTFKPDSLKYHLKACTAEKPFKKKVTAENKNELEEEKAPHLGYNARVAAEQKDGKFTEESGALIGKRMQQPKQIQIKTGGFDNKSIPKTQITEDGNSLDQMYQEMINGPSSTDDDPRQKLLNAVKMGKKA